MQENRLAKLELQLTGKLQEVQLGEGAVVDLSKSLLAHYGDKPIRTPMKERMWPHLDTAKDETVVSTSRHRRFCRRLF